MNRPARYGFDFSTQSADDARRKRLIEAERIADSEHTLSHQKILQRTDRFGLKPVRRRINAQNREVFIRRNRQKKPPRRPSHRSR